MQADVGSGGHVGKWICVAGLAVNHTPHNSLNCSGQDPNNNDRPMNAMLGSS